VDENKELNEATAPVPQPEPKLAEAAPGTPLHDASELIKLLAKTPAVYSNFFLSMFTPEGIRITFAESFGEGTQNVEARLGIFINLETAIKLHATLAQSIQAIMNAKQQQMQATINMMMGAQPPTPPVPEAPPPNAG
jgi:hypothetical protein